MSEKFTCVFDFDIRKFRPNPFHVDTPFGRPETISRGDLAEKISELEEENDKLKARIAELDGMTP